MASVILQAIFGFIIWLVQKIGYFGIFFLMLVESVNIPVPSEVIMPFSGFLAQKGIFNFWLVVLMGALGNLIGSLISYKLARYLLKDGLIQKHRVLRFFVNSNDLRICENWFKKYGAASIFFSRLLPIVRTFISFAAGLAKMNIRVFSILTFSGSFVWSAFLAWLGFIFGENWAVLSVYFRKFDYLILSAIILGIIFWLRSRFHKKSAVNI